jgi:hypothetical protein
MVHRVVCTSDGGGGGGAVRSRNMRWGRVRAKNPQPSPRGSVADWNGTAGGGGGYCGATSPPPVLT